MHLIAYISDYIQTSKKIDDVLNDIIITARLRNAEINVTGVLFYMEGKFLQILEGQESDLRDLLDDIQKDPRHENFQVLIDRPLGERGFNDWHMEPIQLKAGKEFSHHYIKTITSAFENMMILESDTLADFYRSFLEESRSKKAGLVSRFFSALFSRNRVRALFNF